MDEAPSAAGNGASLPAALGVLAASGERTEGRKEAMGCVARRHSLYVMR